MFPSVVYLELILSPARVAVEDMDDVPPLIDTPIVESDDKGEFLFQSLCRGMGIPVPPRH